MALIEHPVYETSALATALEWDGCARISKALPPALCPEVRDAIDGLEPIHWDEVHTDPHGLGGRFFDRYLCVFNRDPFWLPFLDRPGIIDLAEHVLGADCHVIGMTAWRTYPGYRDEGWHVDHQPLTWAEGVLPAAVRVPIGMFTVHYYLSEVDADCAPTRVIPGSHRAGRAPRPDESTWAGISEEIVTAKPGDGFVFRSDLWHAGSANRSADRLRTLLQVHYGRREMAQHFSPYLEWRVNPLVLAQATKRQRRLLGDHEPGAYD